jgi:transposase
MSDVHVLAIDLTKRSCQVCTTDRGGAVLFNRTVSRTKLMQILSSRAPCIVAMEACATSHCWGRVAQSYGHDVRLIPPVFVKPFVKRQKNDAADAAAIAEAVPRPNIHYVGVKSAEHQARAVAFRTHQCFVRQRTQLINALRGHLAEFGIVVAQGPVHLREFAGFLEADRDELPDAVKEMVRIDLDQIDVLSGRIEDLASGRSRPVPSWPLRLIHARSPVAGTSPPGLGSYQGSDRRAARPVMAASVKWGNPTSVNGSSSER